MVCIMSCTISPCLIPFQYISFSIFKLMLFWNLSNQRILTQNKHSCIKKNTLRAHLNNKDKVKKKENIVSTPVIEKKKQQQINTSTDLIIENIIYPTLIMISSLISRNKYTLFCLSPAMSSLTHT